MNAEFHVVIPARLASERLPGKVLREIAGVPMVVRVARACAGSRAASVLVAADDPKTVDVCRAHGVEARLTATDHQSGTDRVHEVATSAGWHDDAIVVNVQGDEPLMPPELVARCAQALADDPSADIATPCHPIHDPAEYRSVHAVMVVMNQASDALLFSRAPIPADRSALLQAQDTLPAAGAWRHIGLYAYRVGALRRYAALPASALERCESLEQLRALDNGMRIRMVRTDQAPGPGVDTEDDLRRVERLLR